MPRKINIGNIIPENSAYAQVNKEQQERKETQEQAAEFKTPEFDLERERARLGIEAPTAEELKARGGRPRNPDLQRGGVQDGLPKTETRATFILKTETLNRLKDFAYTDRLTIKEAIDICISEYLKTRDDLLPHRGRIK